MPGPNSRVLDKIRRDQIRVIFEIWDPTRGRPSRTSPPLARGTAQCILYTYFIISTAFFISS